MVPTNRNISVGYHHPMPRTAFRFSTLLLLTLLCATASEKRIVYPKEFSVGRPNSPGVLVGGTLYVSGQMGRDLKTGKLPATFQAEVQMCLKNIQFILREAHMKWDDVVSMQVYLTDLNQIDELNAVLSQYLKLNRPARTTVGVSGLVGGGHVEISLVAYDEKAQFLPMHVEPH